jgi:acrylyl-CoA reductase (NADPH)
MSSRCMSESFDALVCRKNEAGVQSRIETLTLENLSAGEVVVRTRYAGVNFKDCLAVTGRAKIIAEFPRIAGIEAVGEVLSSADPRFAPGDAVLVHGFQTGIAYDGGFSARMRVPAAHLQKLPAGLSPRDVAAIGVPGFTVAMALERFEANGLRRDSGPIAISGATGAVGMLAISMLARAGYQVAAITRRPAQAEALRRLGATEIVDAEATRSTRPLESGRYAAAIDNVGGAALSWLLRSLRDSGQLASVGNAAGNTYEGSVLPFIMRQVQMFGIVANAPWPQRLRLWDKLAGDWRPDLSQLPIHCIGLADLPAHAERQASGAALGRTLVDFGDPA